MNVALTQRPDPAHDIERARFATDVRKGLSLPRKALPPKWLYDARGSALFDRICELPEYYLTRTETGILRARAEELATLMGQGATLVEFGSGSSTKTRILLDAAAGGLAAYVPIDVSRDYLRQANARLASDYPALRVQAVVADYMELERLPMIADGGRRIGFFPGSTIGNLTPSEARAFLRRAARLLGPGGALIVGVDLIKEKDVLDRAYDDSAGVTAAFTLNLLDRINRELAGDFERIFFRHVAFYAPAASRIEIYLESTKAQAARAAGGTFAFRRDERIHVEYSYKYSLGGFRALAHAAGLTPDRAWTDRDDLFSVHVLAVP